jgi:hypothetical protein
MATFRHHVDHLWHGFWNSVSAEKGLGHRIAPQTFNIDAKICASIYIYICNVYIKSIFIYLCVDLLVDYAYIFSYSFTLLESFRYIQSIIVYPTYISLISLLNLTNNKPSPKSP